MPQSPQSLRVELPRVTCRTCLDFSVSSVMISLSLEPTRVAAAAHSYATRLGDSCPGCQSACLSVFTY